MLHEIVQTLTQFGVAGLMGVLWVWERTLSRKHELQLDEAHQRLAQQRQELEALIDLVQRNTQAVERFDRTQVELRQFLERMGDALQRQAA